MKSERVSETHHARTELYDTLALLSERLNYAKRFDDMVAQKKVQAQQLKREKPVIFIAGVAGVAATVGLTVFAVTNKIIKTFR